MMHADGFSPYGSGPEPIGPRGPSDDDLAAQRICAAIGLDAVMVDPPFFTHPCDISGAPEPFEDCAK